MEQKRSYNYRISPTNEQKQLLARTFGCARFVSNWALRHKTDAYYKEQKRLSSKDLSELLTALKKQDEYAWLSEASSVPLQQALRHLDKAFLTLRLIRENQTICVESLAVKNMGKNEKRSKAMSDVGWSEFVSLLAYNAEWYGRSLVKIDRWYPSSKRCFDCGHLLASFPLDVRSWTCPECGVVHDRDVNAAKNRLAVGLTVSACGETVRPGAVKTNPGTS